MQTLQRRGAGGGVHLPLLFREWYIREAGVCRAARASKHANLFNTTPEYAMRKKRLLKTKRQRNTVALGILGLSDFHLESDEREGA